MPELPQMQALAERLGPHLCGEHLESCELLGFSGLKTATPAPESLFGQTVTRVGRRGKYVTVDFESGSRILIHLSQAGRLDIELPPKATKPRGSVVRLRFSNGIALLVREHGKERKAGWWILAPGDDGPLQKLGPEPDSPEFADFIRSSDDGRRVHTILRDQRTVAGIGRGYSDDAVHRAKLSPYTSLKTLSQDERSHLIDAIGHVLGEGLTLEAKRQGGLSAAKLGEHFAIHNHAGEPCPVCGDTLKRVSYESHEVVYCPKCQTGGRTLADRRLSRLLK